MTIATAGEPLTDTTSDPTAVSDVATRVRRGSARRRLEQRRTVAFWGACAWVGLVVLAALLAGVLPLQDYDRIVAGLSPRANIGAAWAEPFGTDSLGRSTTSRLIYGARQTLAIGLVATLGAMTMGVTIGLVAGYFRGKVASILMVLMDAMQAIPPLVLLLTVAAVGRRGTTTVVVGLVIVFTPTFARLARANTLRVRNRAFVTAARAMGARTARILLREVLPTVVLNLMSYMFLMMGMVVVVEGTLSFLGLGVPPPTPSWGGMINDGRKYLQDAPHLVFLPGACLVLTVMSLSTIGNRIRRRYDSRSAAL